MDGGREGGGRAQVSSQALCSLAGVAGGGGGRGGLRYDQCFQFSALHPEQKCFILK